MSRRSSSALAGLPFEPEEVAGEGASAVVWRAREKGSGKVVAVKVARDGAIGIAEAEVVARVARRWGPALIGAGRTAGGEVYVATEWEAGEPLAPESIAKKDRERVALVVAHGVGRALAELHAAGVRHGDVKPANVILRGRAAPKRDAARERGATLIDLSLAADVASEARGATPRYAAPEILAGGAVGPEADLFALGVVIGEVLAEDRASPLWSWVEALTSRAPGARPAAAWIADRAAERLGLARDEGEAREAREARVRRAYLAVRGADVRGAGSIDAAIRGPARAWLEEALAWRARIDEDATGGGTIAPLDAVGRARWLVALAGASAASWAIDRDGLELRDEGELAAWLVELAGARDPAAWTIDDVLGREARGPIEAPWGSAKGEERAARLARELARARPDARAIDAAERDVARGEATPAIAIELARALLRAGEAGRAWAALRDVASDEGDALHAEVARRRGARDEACAWAERATRARDAATSAQGRAILARLAWDVGDVDAAERALGDARGAAASEVRALCMLRRGQHEAARREADAALASAGDDESRARLEAVRGYVEHWRGDAAASLDGFGRAVDLATRAGAVVEEATYLTGDAAAASDVGAIGRALGSATRAALLWERLGRRGDAAHAWLSRAAALATIGATHAADDAALACMRLATHDGRATAFARWAMVETRAPGDERAAREVIAADRELAAARGADRAVASASEEDRARSAARLVVWAREAIDDARVAAIDAAADRFGAAARWEWWGARARDRLARGDAASGDAGLVVARLAALVDVPASLASRGPALDAATRLATERGDGDAARRFDAARRLAAATLREGTPDAWRASLANVAWARVEPASEAEVSLAPAQIAQLESIVRALSSRDRLRPLLEQALDALVLWTGVERGLLLLRAPNGKLVPRVARNLARRDLRGEQLALSQGIARRALESGEPVVATDALASLGDLHASVHALRLRSVLAVPLVARGEPLGVAYLDDRVRRGAFGPRELAWVRLVASQAALAIADARDHALLARAVRRAERARAKTDSLLAAREAELDATRAELRLAASEETRYPYDAIVGRSEPMRAMLKLVDRVTASDVPVLIVGDSGTGKELIARAIHANGARARRPFVSENCASVPEALLETTLFGHVRGAFTGAASTRAGLFDVADGGTLFLDEIGEMSLAMQSKLLRVLQDGEVRAVGGERTRKVDVRIIAATHRDLSAMVGAGKFREDLFYRLDVITVRVPPLRERADDVPLLVQHFLAKHAPADRRAMKVTRAAMDRLAAFPWPGNVRQLENEVRRAIVLAEGGSIDVAQLSSEIARGGPSAARGAGLDLRSRIDALEASLLREALDKTRGNQTRAAELLGVSRFGLQKMMKRLGIKLG